MTKEIRFPHCDARVLHPPKICKYCDESGLQEVRACWGIAFTGQKPEGDQVPCPANEARSDESLYSWGGNRPQPPEEEMVLETASFETCTRCNCVLFDNEKSLGVCIICRDLDATYLNDDCTLSNKSCPKYYGKYENGKWTGNKLCTCVEGRCWYDEQKARRKDGLKAIAPESWDGGK